MYMNWNQNLCTIREAISLNLHKDSINLHILQTAINYVSRQCLSVNIDAFSIDYCMTFNIQLLKLPNNFIDPVMKAQCITNLLKMLRKYLILFDKTLIMRKPGNFMNLIEFFKNSIDSELFLYIYQNVNTKKFINLTIKIKELLIRLYYECTVSNLHMENIAYIYDWYINFWQKLGFINFSNPNLQFLQIPPKTIIPNIQKEPIKYLSEFCKYRYKKSIMEAIFTGESSDLFKNAYLNKLASKNEAKIPEYLQIFYELLKILEDVENQRKLFESQLDCSLFFKSFVYSMIEYFCMNIEYIADFTSYQIFFDILRLTSKILTESNKKQLFQIAAKNTAKMDNEKFNIEMILLKIQQSFDGKIFISELCDISIIETPKILTKINLDKFMQILNEIYNDFTKNYDGIEYEIYEKLRNKEIIGKSINEIIFDWTIKIVESENYNNIDKQKNLLEFVKLLYKNQIIDYEKYKEIYNKLIQKLIDKFNGIILLKNDIFQIKSTLLFENVVLLKNTASLEEIKEFISKNPEIYNFSIKKLSNKIKDLSEKLKIPAEQFKILNKTTKKLQENLQTLPKFNDLPLKIKLLGSASYSLWNNFNEFDCNLILEKDLLPIWAYNPDFIKEIKNKISEIGEILSKDNKFPIKYKDKETGLFVNLLGINKNLEQYASQLILLYIKYDDRIRQLILFIKEWLKINKMSHIFSGYLITLFVIFYCQNITKPPILPNLQQIFISKPKDFTDFKKYITLSKDGKIEIQEKNIYFEQKIDKVKPLYKNSINSQPTGEILFEFFCYFSYNFNVFFR